MAHIKYGENMAHGVILQVESLISQKVGCIPTLHHQMEMVYIQLFLGSAEDLSNLQAEIPNAKCQLLPAILIFPKLEEK